MSALHKIFGAGSTPKESTEALFQKGQSFLQAGDTAAALASFQQMLRQSESEVTGKNTRDRLFNLIAAVHNGAAQRNAQAGGNIYFSAGLEQLDAEISLTELLLHFEPRSADLWYGLGLAWDNHARCERAEQCYRRAIELDPDGVIGGDAWNNLGILHRNLARSVRVKDTSGNMQTVPMAGLRREQLFPTKDSAIAINIQRESPYWKSAEAAFERALAIFGKLAMHKPGFTQELVRSHWGLAQLHTDLIQGSKAIPHIQEIHRLDPNNQQAIDWLQEAERNTGKKLL